MPGLVGFTDKNEKYDKNVLPRMAKLITHFDKYVRQEYFSDGIINGTGVHLSIANHGRQPVKKDECLLWIEGEIYNCDELKKKYGLLFRESTKIILDRYIYSGSFEFLKEIDGNYAAVLYDKKKKTINLINDRYGLKPLYWGRIGNNYIWCSELKGFLGYSDFEIVFDEIAVKEFFEIGYVLGNRTWFKGVELVPPGSVLVIDFEKSTHKIIEYWSWEQIELLKEPIDLEGVSEELGKNFVRAVEKRVNESEKIGVTLSGGLDSRAIVAAVPDYYKPLHVFTFGKKNCREIKIAKKVAKTKKAIHHIYELNPSSWLMPRINGVWKSDGFLNLLHMHGYVFHENYAQYADIILNGYLGDAILGGFYITKGNRTVEKVRNRGRRFINQALVLGECRFIIRKPFFDNKLIELIFAIPEKYRKKSYIYNKMLLKIFPEYFKHIPWDKTGLPINSPKFLTNVYILEKRIANKIIKEGRKRNYNIRDNKTTNYELWIKEKKILKLIKNIIHQKNAIYPNYIDRKLVYDIFEKNIKGKDILYEEVCRILTFEIWLQQVFNGLYRNGL